MTLLVARAEYERMLTELEAERYTHSNESMDDVQRRISWERPESPRQQFYRRAYEARRDIIYNSDLVASVIVEAKRRSVAKVRLPRPIPQSWEVLREMRSAGMGWTEMSKILGLPYSTVHNRAKRMGLVGFKKGETK